mgnify:CR=1 FL=1
MASLCWFLAYVLRPATDVRIVGMAEVVFSYFVSHRLLRERMKRIPPGRDDKVLADWNGLMIAALARAARIVERMRAVDTAGVEPLAHPVAAFQDVQLRLRPDQATEPNQREANQRSAPAVERGLFLVPKVIE